MGYRLVFENWFQKLSLISDFARNSVAIDLFSKALKFFLLGFFHAAGDEVCKGLF